MYVAGWLAGYVWYLELSRKLKHTARKMWYQNVGHTIWHCLGIVFFGYGVCRARASPFCTFFALSCAEFSLVTQRGIRRFWDFKMQVGKLTLKSDTERKTNRLRLTHALHALTSSDGGEAPQARSRSLTGEEKRTFACMYVAGWLAGWLAGWVCVVSGIISQTKTHSAENVVPKCR